MPRYYFATRVGEDRVADPDGQDLPDPDAAWTQARRLIRSLLRESGPHSRLYGACLEVTDEAGEIVFEFPFAEALHEPDPPEDPPDATRH